MKFNSEEIERCFEKSKETVKSFGADKFCEKKKKMEKFAPRILLVGPSGMGKSTLVNDIFGIDDKEGASVRAGGEPCTTCFEEFSPRNGIPVSIIDSRGIEKDISSTQRKEIVEYVRKKNNDIDNTNHVHIAWYVPGDRWEKSDTEYLSELSRVVNVVVAVTRADLRQGIDPETKKTALELTHEAIQKDIKVSNQPDMHIVDVASPPEGSQHWVPSMCKLGHGRGNFLISNRRGTWNCEAELKAKGTYCSEHGTGTSGPYGHLKLLEITADLIPNVFRASLDTAQIVDVKRKNSVAAGIIVAHVIAAIGIGAVALPCADLPLLLGLETSMVAQLFFVYNIDMDMMPLGVWVQLNASLLGIVGFVGSGLADLMKMTLVLAPFGAAIDGTVAGLVVSTFGVVVAMACAKLSSLPSGHHDKEQFEDILWKCVDSAKSLINFKQMMGTLSSEEGKQNLFNEISSHISGN